MPQNSPSFSPSASLRWSAHSANFVIPNSQNGLGFTNAGAPGTITATLPAAYPGLFFSFAVVDAHTYAVQRKAGSSDLIYVGATQASSWGATQVGSVLVFEAVKVGVWMATSMLGNWS